MLKFISIFAMVATLMAMLYQVGLGIATYLSESRKQNISVQGMMATLVSSKTLTSLVACNSVASTFISNSLSLRLIYQTTRRDA